jgi:hypothetical protein
MSRWQEWLVVNLRLESEHENDREPKGQGLSGLYRTQRFKAGF